MTKTYDIMIGLRQLLYMCKAEKTQLNDRLQLGVSVLNELLQTKYKRQELKICFVWKVTEYILQSIEISRGILCRTYKN